MGIQLFTAQIRILVASTSLSIEMGKELTVLIFEKKKLKLGNCYIRIGINSETFANRISALLTEGLIIKIILSKSPRLLKNIQKNN